MSIPPHVSKLVAGVKQGHAHCKILLFQQILFLCLSNFMEIIGLKELGKSGHPHCSWIMLISNSGVCL